MDKIITLCLYDISADGGNSWSTQWLTETEATNEKEMYGHIVLKRDHLLIPAYDKHKEHC